MAQAVKLLEHFYAVSGDKITHPWDASAYLITGDEPVLIDCGGADGYPALKRNLAELGLQPRQITKVIATHGHWDHVSGFAPLAEESDAELWIHENDREQVEQGDYDRTGAFLYGKPFPPVKVHRTLVHGETLAAGGFRLEVIHTPGHSPGSVCFLLTGGAHKVLVAGDTLWGGYHDRVRSDLEAWQASLDLLLTHDFELMTFGHLPPTLVYDAKKKVAEARKQLGVYFTPWFKPMYETFQY
ncbi:MBL fold metallo-hydrolase [Paenibacillus sp. GCM10023248]|uniref:MBL fold metallo-hydrolase n=1 Tax=Bacillales TaxID=1385 RepID=UPI002379F749|nr:MULTISPECIES: MBL fold metallo-hydrolase [Bacillales]MDD9267364.1 MBL fold metallo-hydrolase [Paenibacillus sp. MAHUQ-63]MDR6882578.1 glyoxylase-like metal-dependent hydrolase (beta-lactamase superfamily II) [Bacillus sp. 3255]